MPGPEMGKLPQKYRRQGQCFIPGGLFRPADAARNPDPPSTLTSAGVGANAGQSNPIPKIRSRNDANPLANRTSVLYPTFSKSGSTAVGRIPRPPRQSTRRAADLPFLENHNASGVHRAITSEIGFRNTANPSVLQSLDSRP